MFGNIWIRIIDDKDIISDACRRYRLGMMDEYDFKERIRFISKNYDFIQKKQLKRMIKYKLKGCK